MSGRPIDREMVATLHEMSAADPEGFDLFKRIVLARLNSHPKAERAAARTLARLRPSLRPALASWLETIRG